jgi:AmmeMemoRadiSam system protein A
MPSTSSRPAAAFPCRGCCSPRAGTACGRLRWTCATPAIRPARAIRSSATAHGSSAPTRRATPRAIEFGLREARGLPLDPESLPPAWREPRATFVTLRRGGQLRGCTGSLEARQPLACDVAHNAYRSAFADPRFPPLQPGELADLDVSVSVLGPLEPLGARSEEELVAQLRPGLDGLVLSEGPRSATFLPAVWDSLPDPRDFLDALRRKAGLPPGYWSSTLRFERYAVEEAG